MSAPCLGAPAYLFFPEDEDPTVPAPDLCLTCPSSLPCLQSGWTETWGAWGGFNPAERMQARINKQEPEDLWITKFQADA